MIGYDSVTLANIPADAAWVGCYVDGAYANEAEARRRFPNAHIATITVYNGVADVLDVEQGDATPDMVPWWIARMRGLGRKAVVYCNSSTWPQVINVCGANRPDGYWIAQYDHRPDIDVNWVNAGCVAKQFIGDEGGKDTSNVLDTWPGLQPQGERHASVRSGSSEDRRRRGPPTAHPVLERTIQPGSRCHQVRTGRDQSENRGMTLTGVVWVDWLLIAAAVLTALLTIWRRAVHPIVRIISVIDEAAPVLVTIATEFRPNGGGSLRDSIDRIERTLDRRGRQIEDLAVKVDNLREAK